jgi:aspartate dehydrogenase
VCDRRYRVGLIGFGTIGAQVCTYLLGGGAPGARLAGVLVRPGSGATPTGVARMATVEELLASRPDVVVELASREALTQLGPAVVDAGVDLLAVSTGAFLDDELRDRIVRSAAQRGARVRLVTGAVGGIDALRAAVVDGLESVEVEQTKPAASLLAGDEIARLESPTTVYEGLVRDAVSAFPKTTNILATVALAGLGADRTRVRIVADPGATSNRVRLVARGQFGSFELEMDNRPSENPRTSVITALSVIAALRSMFDPLAIA